MFTINIQESPRTSVVGVCQKAYNDRDRTNKKKENNGIYGKQ